MQESRVRADRSPTGKVEMGQPQGAIVSGPRAISITEEVLIIHFLSHYRILFIYPPSLLSQHRDQGLTAELVNTYKLCSMKICVPCSY